MNKKLALGLAATCAATLFAATQVSADELHETTDGSIIFYKDNKPKPGPFEKNLSLAYVPGEFNFGTNTLNGVTGTKVYNKVATGPQYLAVSDDRVVKDGWSLVADMGEFVSSKKNSTSKLDNAELSMTLGTGQRYNIDAKASDEAGTPVPHITEAGSLEAIPTSFLGKLKLEKPIKLVAGATGTTNIMKYSYAQGAPVDADGVTVGIASEVQDVRLTVQDHSNLDEAKYTTTVNWALSATATD